MRPALRDQNVLLAAGTPNIKSFLKNASGSDLEDLVGKEEDSWQLHRLLQLATASRKSLDHPLLAASRLVNPLTQALAAYPTTLDPASADGAPYEAGIARSTSSSLQGHLSRAS